MMSHSDLRSMASAPRERFRIKTETKVSKKNVKFDASPDNSPTPKKLKYQVTRVSIKNLPFQTNNLSKPVQIPLSSGQLAATISSFKSKTNLPIR